MQKANAYFEFTLTQNFEFWMHEYRLIPVEKN